MNEPYLWDKTGTPDPETVRLERLLGGLSHRRQELTLPKALQMEVARYEAPFQLTQLSEEPLWLRLAQAARVNWQGFIANPRAYWQAMTAQTNQEQVRRAAFRWCFGSIFVVHIISYGTIFLMPGKALEKITSDTEKRDLQLISMIEPAPPPAPEKAKGRGGKPAGGGGGNHELTPASKGRLPQASLTAPPIVAPSTHQRIEQPSLPVVPTIQVDPDLVAKQDPTLPIGDPKGVLGAPSDGPGSGGGIDRGTNGGVGPNASRGFGPGTHDGRVGGSGHGDGTGTANLRPTILSQVKPRYTEEARQHKIQGKVTLSVEFRADGTIGDIRVLRGLGYGLDETAIEAARLIRFRPAVSNGSPVTTRAKVEFTFNLI